MKTNIREYNEEMEVEILANDEKSRLVLVAYNEAGFNEVKVDLIDILGFVRKNMNDLWELTDKWGKIE